MDANYFTILYWFCYTSTWIRHGCTCVPHPEPPSHLPSRTIPLGHPSAPAPSILYPALNLDWRFVSYMILYMFQCHSPHINDFNTDRKLLFCVRSWRRPWLLPLGGNGVWHIPGAFLLLCQGGKLGFKNWACWWDWCEECCTGLLLLHIIHHLVAAKNHHSLFFLCLWGCGARLIWPRLGWAALYQMLQLDGKMCFSLQLCGSMGMALLHVPLLLLGPASQPGHVFLRQWQRCKRAKRNMFAKPRLRAQVLLLQLIYHRSAGVAGLGPKSWSIKGHLVRHWQGYGCREKWKTDATDNICFVITWTVHSEEKEFQFLFTSDKNLKKIDSYGRMSRLIPLFILAAWHVECGILVSWPGSEPMPPAGEAWTQPLNHQRSPVHLWNMQSVALGKSSWG